LLKRGCALTDGTFSVVFAKQHVRTPRVACRWLENIKAADKTGNEQHCRIVERRIVTADAISALAAYAVVRDFKPASIPGPCRPSQDDANGRLLMRKRIQFLTVLVSAVVGILTLSGCSSGGGGGNHPTINDLVVVPGSSSVPVNQTAQFSAFLNGAVTSATWSASAGTIDNTGLFTAPTAPASVTITATSGSNTGTTTVTVGAAQTLVVNPAALTIPAGGLQSFTATPSAGVVWTVNGVAFGDCITAPIGTVTQCHGVIDGNGNYTAPLSPPTGGSVTIGAAGGGNSGTSTATILYSSASLTTTTVGTGQYAVAFTGIDFTAGFPVDVAGSVVTSGSASSSSGTITGGEMDLNAPVASPNGVAVQVPVTGGSFTVGALDGRTSILLTLASNSVAPSFTLQATLGTNQHSLLIDFDTSDTGSGTLDAQNPTAFAAPLNGRFAYSYFGLDTNLNPVTVAGTFLASNNSIPVNNPNSPVNAQDLAYVPLNSNIFTVVTNDLTVSGLYTTPDSFGRGTITMNSTPLSTLNFAYYMIDQTHLKLVEIDPSETYVLFGEAYSSPLNTTPLNGGIALTFGGAANNAPYAGGGFLDQWRYDRQRRHARHQQQRRQRSAEQLDDHQRKLCQHNIFWKRPGSLHSFSHHQQGHRIICSLYLRHRCQHRRRAGRN
jgi:hypothetical protein